MVQKSLIYEKIERYCEQEKTCKIQKTRSDKPNRILLIQDAPKYYKNYLSHKNGRQIQEEIEI